MHAYFCSLLLIYYAHCNCFILKNESLIALFLCISSVVSCALNTGVVEWGHFEVHCLNQQFVCFVSPY